MKRVLIVMAAIIALMACVIGAESVRWMEIPEPVREAVVTPNEVDLYMPSNPTTGYSWSCEVEDPEIVAIRDKFFEDSHELGFTGVGGTHWFHISGVKPGTTSVTFSYFRPWETEEEPLQMTRYRLTVDDGLNVMIWGVEVIH